MIPDRGFPPVPPSLSYTAHRSGATQHGNPSPSVASPKGSTENQHTPPSAGFVYCRILLKQCLHIRSQHDTR